VPRSLGGRDRPARPTQGDCFTVVPVKHSQNSGIDWIKAANLASPV
jgi:hypothetical protein